MRISAIAHKWGAAFTKNKWRGCRLFLLTFIRVPSFTKTCLKSHGNLTRYDAYKAFTVMNVVIKSRQAGDSQLNDCVKGSAGVVHGRQGGQQKTMLLSYSYPARLQQALLPPDAVLNVDQTQQILLRHKGKEEQSDKERKSFGEHYQNL